MSGRRPRYAAESNETDDIPSYVKKRESEWDMACVRGILWLMRWLSRLECKSEDGRFDGRDFSAYPAANYNRLFHHGV